MISDMLMLRMFIQPGTTTEIVQDIHLGIMQGILQVITKDIVQAIPKEERKGEQMKPHILWQLKLQWTCREMYGMSFTTTTLM